MADPNGQQDGDTLLTVNEVADLFSVQPATIREWLKEGIITGIKIGKGHYWRIRRSEVTRLATERYGE